MKSPASSWLPKLCKMILTMYSSWRNLGTDIVSIYVSEGEGQKHYAVHRNLLMTKSEHFKNVLHGNSKEETKATLHLKKDDPAAISLLISWLYTGILPGSRKAKAIKTISRESRDHFTDSTDSTKSSAAPILSMFQPLTNIPNLLVESPNCRAQHVCFQPQYEKWSPEELRLSDYKFFGGKKPEQTPFHSFTVPTPANHRFASTWAESASRVAGPALTSSPAALTSPVFASSQPVLSTSSAGPAATDAAASIITENDDAETLALLHLCLFAEHYFWPELFIAAMEAYICSRQEQKFPLPVSHAELVYERSRPNSTLRAYIVDSITNVEGRGNVATYIKSLKNHDEILEDILKKIDFVTTVLRQSHGHMFRHGVQELEKYLIFQGKKRDDEWKNVEEESTSAAAPKSPSFGDQSKKLNNVVEANTKKSDNLKELGAPPTMVTNELSFEDISKKLKDMAEAQEVQMKKMGVQPLVFPTDMSLEDRLKVLKDRAEEQMKKLGLQPMGFGGAAPKDSTTEEGTSTPENLTIRKAAEARSVTANEGSSGTMEVQSEEASVSPSYQTAKSAEPPVTRKPWTLTPIKNTLFTFGGPTTSATPKFGVNSPAGVGEAGTPPSPTNSWTVLDNNESDNGSDKESDRKGKGIKRKA